MSILENSGRISERAFILATLIQQSFVEEFNKNLKFDILILFKKKRSKFKAFVIQLNLYIFFNGTCFASEIERVL